MKKFNLLMSESLTDLEKTQTIESFNRWLQEDKLEQISTLLKTLGVNNAVFNDRNELIELWCIQ